jgi:hypothetical protein
MREFSKPVVVVSKCITFEPVRWFPLCFCRLHRRGFESLPMYLVKEEILERSKNELKYHAQILFTVCLSRVSE